MNKILKGLLAFLAGIIFLLAILLMFTGLPGAAIPFLIISALFILPLYPTKKQKFYENINNANLITVTGGYIDGIDVLIPRTVCYLTIQADFSQQLIIYANDNMSSSIALNISQIQNIGVLTEAEVIEYNNKSVVGRGLVGGLLLGNIGAVIGGMSALKSNRMVERKHYLIINYLDKSNELKSISFSVMKSNKLKKMIAFITQKLQKSRIEI